MQTINIKQEVAKWPTPIDVTTHKCRMCGERFSTGRWVNDVAINMRNRSLCFEDNHWYDLWLRRNETDVVRIAGQHYVIGAPGVSKKWAGFGGDSFTIRLFSGLTLTTSNLWHQGDIPTRWQRKLPNNAEFVKEI